MLTLTRAVRASPVCREQTMRPFLRPTASSIGQSFLAPTLATATVVVAVFVVLIVHTPSLGQQVEFKLAPRRETGKIINLSGLTPTTNVKVESVTLLPAQLTRQINRSTQSINQTSSRLSPVLQRLIAQTQATQGDVTKIESGHEVGREHEVSARARDEISPPPPPPTGLLRQAKCANHGRARSLRELLTSAKNLATGGFSSVEQRAGNIFWFGSNILATLIPLASLLPNFSQITGGTNRPSGDSGGGGGGGGEATQSASAASTSTSTSASAGKQTVGLTKLSPQNLIVSLASNAGGLQSRVEHVMGWLERSIEHLPNFPRLHPQECVKRCICEAHASPTKYGALGLTLRLLFPASQLDILEGQDNMDYKVINKYRHAAGYGMARRVMESSRAIGETGRGNATGGGTGGWTSVHGEHNNLAATSACREKYEDCLVSLLDVAQNLVDFFLANKSTA